jgi:hypothetical protein
MDESFWKSRIIDEAKLLEARDESVEVPLVAYNRGQREVIGRATVSLDGRVEAVIDEPAKNNLAEIIRKNVVMDLSLQFSIPAIPVDSEGKIRFRKTY